jgi:cell wall-associated NlpC family hydrolase
VKQRAVLLLITNAVTVVPAFILLVCVLGILGGGTSSVITGQSCLVSSGIQAAAGSSASGAAGSPSPPASGIDLKPSQMAIASTIVSVAKGLHLSRRDAAIGVMTGMQESTLANLNYGDAAGPDSRGVFQQRPMYYPDVNFAEPASEAEAFFTREGAVPDRDQLPMYEVAHLVQRNQNAGDYAKWQNLGTSVATALWTGSASETLACTDTHAGTITLPKGAPDLTSSGSSVIDAVRTWALAQLGTSYVYAGSCTDSHISDPSKHCDCSSLVQQAYAHVGISLPRTTFQQYLVGTPVPIRASAVLPGDLLFEMGDDPGPAGEPGHVGLYLGQGLVIEAPFTGDVVKIQTLSSWLPQIVDIRRIVQDGQTDSSTPVATSSTVGGH